MKNFRTFSDWLGIGRTVSDCIELFITIHWIIYYLSDWFGIRRIDSDSNSFGRFGQFRTPVDYFGLCRIHSESVGSFLTPSFSDDSDSFGHRRIISDIVGLFRTSSDWFGIRIETDQFMSCRIMQKSENFSWSPKIFYGVRKFTIESENLS